MPHLIFPIFHSKLVTNSHFSDIVCQVDYNKYYHGSALQVTTSNICLVNHPSGLSRDDCSECQTTRQNETLDRQAFVAVKSQAGLNPFALTVFFL